MTKEERAVYNREWYLKNKEKKAAQHKKWQEENKDKVASMQKKCRENNLDKYKDRERNFKLQSQYGITAENYNEMFINQKGCCKICGIHQDEFVRKLAVDHCHATGEVRGLLCCNCNTGLGKFKDNIDLLENAIKYLTNNI